MSVFLTVLSGVLVYVLGQLVLKLLIDPVNELKKTISKISYDLVFYADVLANPKPKGDERMDKATRIMREHSSLLHANAYLIPCYEYTRLVFGLPKEEKIIAATENLIGLSNGFDGVLAEQGILNAYKMQHTKVNLGIRIPKGDWLDLENEIKFIKVKFHN
ncbi:hypothetical protein [Candidatus Symbiopectobacterium sp. NZEC135]|uniref:hypothetical protein n=1 Tax=Candidatus Symbiopectobacterium sp. NZEC135 TaxID=2820471 RepID=UPI0022269062|nr:hypothetical protein [Candidatus Symbiopectobacterium sp. NZEC135]MCW2478136.1 hypothetical protein [Candidatus Symbiopectobacterium sp. NZEC135]